MFKKALLVGLLATSAGANANFIHGDLNSAGDQLVSLDTSTGLEWLKLGNTVNTSINQFLLQTAEGAKYEGWRLATDSEVEAVLTHFFPSLRFNEGYTPEQQANYGEVPNFTEYMGATGPAHSQGLHPGDGGNGDTHATGIYNTTVYDDWAESGDIVSQKQDYAHKHIGVFAVNEGNVSYSSMSNQEYSSVQQANATNDVSAPLALGVFGAAMLGLGLRRRKR